MHQRCTQSSLSICIMGNRLRSVYCPSARHGQRPKNKGSAQANRGIAVH